MDERASKPASEAATSHWRFLWLLYRRIMQDRLLDVAAGVTFYTLLALFPALAALVSVYGLFADPMSLERHLAGMRHVLPSGATQVIGAQLQQVVMTRHATLGTTFAVALALSLWSANAGTKALIAALNIAYGARERRGFLHLNAVSLVLTTGGIALALIWIGAAVVRPLLFGDLILPPGLSRLVAFVKWPLLITVIALAITILYRHGPYHVHVRWHWISPGSACASLAWLAISLLFSWYTSAFGWYDRAYGPLAAVIGFMTWIWLSTIMILLGAEIDALRAPEAHRSRHRTHRVPARADPS